MNDYKTSVVIPNVGFCICKDSTLYISNNYVKGFKIDNSIGYNTIVLLTNNESYYIYKDESNRTYEEFKKIFKSIINEILNILRYSIHNNINIDEIINEVINNEC